MLDANAPVLLALAFIVYFGVVAYERLSNQSTRALSVIAGVAALVITAIYLFGLF